MKNFLFAAIVLLISTGAHAQKVYFIFLQSENNQPFFVKMADKIYSSSSTGYLIIPDLKENTYRFNLGFANQKSPETNFSVEITNTDRGLLIKNFEEGISLFDLQSLAVYRPVKDVGTVQHSVKKTDSFTQLLSKAADDESILTTVVTKKIEAPVVKEEKKEEVMIKTSDTIIAIAPPPVNTIDTTKTLAVHVETEIKAPIVEERKSEQTATSKSETTIVPVEKEEPKSSNAETAVAAIVPESIAYNEQTDSGMELFKKSIVTKRSESSTTEGFGLVYLDDVGGIVDTIRLLIPNPKIVFAEEVKQPAVITEDIIQESVIKAEANIAEEQTKKEKKGLLAKLSKSEKENSASEKAGDISIEKQESTTTVETVDTPENPQKKESGKGLLERLKKSEPKETAPATVNGRPLCSAFASDNDFMKLRRNMAAKTSDDAMVDEAKKIFRTKCFTSEQIKNLSYLFLSPAGKYQFFDAAYNHVVDQWQFADLQNELKDEYYQKRFKALIGD
jgi:hypothetical protein